MSTKLTWISDLALFALGLLLTPLAYALWLRNRRRDQLIRSAGA